MLLRAALPVILIVDAFAIAGLLAQTPPSATRRIPQLENEHVRVWKSIIMPRQPLSMHRHEHGRTIVALKGGTLKIVEKTGESHTATWQTGNAYWLDADPPGAQHADLNEGPEPIEVMVIEMKK